MTAGGFRIKQTDKHDGPGPIDGNDGNDQNDDFFSCNEQQYFKTIQ